MEKKQMSFVNLGVHALIQNNNGEILLLKRGENVEYMPMKWDLPGGKLEIGESVENALYREVLEETGVGIEIQKPIYVYTNLSQLPILQTVQIIYLCTYRGETINLNIKEHIEYKWIEYEGINNLSCMPFLNGLIKHYNKMKIC